MGKLNLEEIGEWFEAEAGSLVLYARQWLDAGQAEDVVQEVFIRLMQHEIDEEHVKGWLYRVVRNLSLNQLRSAGRRRHREDETAIQADGWLIPDPGAGIDARQAEAVLRALPSEEREIVTLRVWGGLTLEQIAAVLELSAATVLRKHRAALKRLKTELETPCLTKVH